MSRTLLSTLLALAAASGAAGCQRESSGGNAAGGGSPSTVASPAAADGASGSPAACPANMPVGHVTCAQANLECHWSSGGMPSRCTCGDWDHNGTMFWECTTPKTGSVKPGASAP
jgi:hypothetical protein